MKNDNKKTVIVGIFVLIGIIILVLGVLTLGAQQKAFVKSFRVYAVFDDIGGLQTGNNVWFSGVKIGTVKKINFYGDSQVEIEMNLESNARDFIRKNSKATISSDGLIGNKIIVIYGGTNEAPIIDPGDRLEAVMPLDTDRMMETLQENNKNLVSITTDLKVLTGRIAAGDGIVGALLTDSSLAVSLRELLVDLDRSAQNSRILTSELASFSKKLNQKGTPIDEFLRDTTLVGSLKASTSGLEETIQQANVAAENLQLATKKLGSSDNAAGMLLNDKDFAAYIKGTVHNLEEGTESFNETLEALRYHWFFRRSFRKSEKARQEALEE
ncbi:ABC transporter, permease component [Lunatimonas lonarensis]|uniref:ABC transporter, permease component n=1 Tax=Lunatimonas lonarensis TaxID=1232681 RepID=R7ZWY1_9BACT|nr:MlaD family protein [Lunatimonas lonarensis]EON78660.1 ABC transporter, permease component [Lunatimonas lonarensis]